MKNVSIGKNIAGCVLALVFAIPAFFSTIALMLPGLVVATLGLAVVGAWSGMLSTFVGSLAIALFAQYLGGPYLVVAALLVTVMPAWVILYLLKKRVPFFNSALIAIGAQLVGFLLLVIGARIVLRGDLVDEIIVFMRTGFETLPNQVVDMLLEVLIQKGVLQSPIEGDLGTALYVAINRKRLWATFLDTLLDTYSTTLRIALPSAIINCSIITGLLSNTLARKICVRRNEEPLVPYVTVDKWYLPGSVIVSALLCWLLGYIGLQTKLSGGAVLHYTMRQLVILLFMIQGFAATSRMMRMRGTSPGMRTLFLVLMAIFAQFLLSFVGGFSAIFGSRGAFTEFMQKRAEKHKGDD